MVTRRKKTEKSDQGTVQGEGDYQSARRFNEKERNFVGSHDTDELAEKATPENAEQAAEMEKAEREGNARGHSDPNDDMQESDRDEDPKVSDETPPKH